jgi:hypothetical protein
MASIAFILRKADVKLLVTSNGQLVCFVVLAVFW